MIYRLRHWRLAMRGIECQRLRYSAQVGQTYQVYSPDAQPDDCGQVAFSPSARCRSPVRQAIRLPTKTYQAPKPHPGTANGVERKHHDRSVIARPRTKAPAAAIPATAATATLVPGDTRPVKDQCGMTIDGRRRDRRHEDGHHLYFATSR